MSTSKQKVFENIEYEIERVGYALITINSKSTHEPVFTYSVGLSSMGLPELVFVRRPTSVVRRIIDTLIEMAKSGWTFDGHNTRIKAILEHDLALIKAQKTVSSDLMSVAVDYSNQSEKKYSISLDNVCVVCWPDGDGAFPGEEGYKRSIDSNIVPFEKAISTLH